MVPQLTSTITGFKCCTTAYIVFSYNIYSTLYIIILNYDFTTGVGRQQEWIMTHVVYPGYFPRVPSIWDIAQILFTLVSLMLFFPIHSLICCHRSFYLVLNLYMTVLFILQCQFDCYIDLLSLSAMLTYIVAARLYWGQSERTDQ